MVRMAGWFSGGALAALLVVTLGVRVEPAHAQSAGDTLVDPNAVDVKAPEATAPGRRVVRFAPGAGPTAAGTPSTQPAAFEGPAPKLEMAEMEHNFGRVIAGDAVNHTFKGKNTGPGVLKILNVHPTCGCTVAQGWANTVEPGGTWALPVSLRTTGFQGPVTKTIAVTTNDPANPTIVLKLIGEIAARFKFQPSQLIQFGRITPSTVSTQTIQVLNQLSPPTKIKGAKVVQYEAGKMVDNKSFTVAIKELPDNKGYELAVTSVPPLPEGTSRAMVQLEIDSAQEPLVNVPIFAHCPPRIEVTPITIPMPVPINRPTIRTVTIRNNGEAPLNILEAVVSDASVTADIKKQDDGKAFTLLLSFPAGVQIPDQGLSLRILTDDQEKPKIEIPIQALRPRAIMPRPGGQTPVAPAPNRMPGASPSAPPGAVPTAPPGAAGNG